MKLNRLRLAVIIQLAFFTAWGAYLLAMRSAVVSGDIYLETEPVDPRDLFSGTYVALNYAVSNPQAGACQDIIRSGPGSNIYVRLEKGPRTVSAGGRQLPLYDAADCLPQPPASSDALWAEGTVASRFRWNARIDYGIEKFFVNEADPLKDARSGSVVARASLDRRGRLHITGLIAKDGDK